MIFIRDSNFFGKTSVMTFSNHSPRVLCFSRDPLLLKTREQVLSTRYEGVAVSSVEELKALDTDEGFDVVLLCHTLSVDECELSAQVVRVRWPHAKIVAMSLEQGGCFEAADRIVRGLDGPGLLLNTIDQLTAPWR